MSKITTSSSPKVNCERYKKHLRAYSVKRNSTLGIMKNTLPLGTNIPSCNRNKSLSTGVLNNNTVVKPKKTTKSDLICQSHLSKFKVVDCNKSCGDTLNTIQTTYDSKSNTKQHHSMTSINIMSSKHAINTQNGKKSFKQFYRNNNFLQSTESMHSSDCGKDCYLNSIKEQKEKESSSESYSILEIVSDCEEGANMDPNDYESIKNLKQFRDHNYFECHSAKSRIQSKGSVTSLRNHKCVYRFYLNDRLFPVPLNTDHNKAIRCIECHLPLDTDNSPGNSNINGTIQAKVKLNSEVQDMMLMLPVTESFIVKERRTELKDKKEEDFVYFGIIKLNLNGDSIFNQNMPSNSFALKYQKGYKKYVNNKKYEYGSLDNNDVIII